MRLRKILAIKKDMLLEVGFIDFSMDFKKYVNNMYLQEDVLRGMKEAYLKSGELLKLEGFLKEEVFSELVRLLKDIRGEHVKVADRYSYNVLNSLSGVEKLFSSSEIVYFVNSIAGKDFEDVDLKIFGFGHRDYSLLHDSETRKGTEFLFVFCDVWNDSFGGQIVYTDNKEKSYIFPILGNSFILLDREGLGDFVKYINHLAGENRFLLIVGRLK